MGTTGMKATDELFLFQKSTHSDLSGSQGHSVQFYEDDSFLLDTLSRFIGAALTTEESAIVIATKVHRDGLAQRLKRQGLDLTPAMHQGRYIALDAAETLTKFMVDDWPDAQRFYDVVGNLIMQLTATARGERSSVAAFGEMVALLWAEGKSDAAVYLEQLWNELGRRHSFQLHCAYPMTLFSQGADDHVKKICLEHSHVVPAESYTALLTEEERLRGIILLQQKAQALEAEMAERHKTQRDLQKREAELSDFLENAVLGMHWVGADGTILWANKAEMSGLGYSHDEYVGHHISEFHADPGVIADILQRLGQNQELQGYGARLRCKDGSIRHVRIHSNVFMDSGKFVHTRCFTVDVTAHERSERLITAQHAITRLLAESRTVGDIAAPALEIICGASECDMGAFWLVEEQSQKIRCIKTWRRESASFPQMEEATISSRFNKGEGIAGRIWAANQPVWIPNIAVESGLPRKSIALEEGIRSAFAFPLGVQGDPLGVIEFFARQPKLPDDELMKTMATVSTQIGQFIERKQAEQALRESEERLRLAQRAAGIGTFEWNLQSNVNRWMPELEVLHGLAPGSFAQTYEAWEELVHPEDRIAARKQVELSFETCAPAQGEWRVVWPDGSIHWMSGRWQVFKDGSGIPIRLAGVNVDVTDRKQAEEARWRLAAIVESSDDAIVSKDLTGVVRTWNDSAMRIFGYTAEEMVGRSILTLVPPELHGDEPRILAKIHAGERIEHFETVRVRKDGERIDVSLTVSPIRDQHGRIVGAAKIVRDITQQKKLEEALHTNERLASVGRLAASVAHEINNPLEAVTNFIYLAKQQPALPEKIKNYLERADKELARVSHIAQQTLGFYRDNSHPIPLVVSGVIEDVLAIYESKFSYHNLRIEKRIDPNLVVCTLQGELKQIVSNLIANAIDASREGGKIVISARTSRHLLTGGGGIRITIADDGSGIPEEYRKKLFTPFFTTKKEVGTGLGLWITKDLLEKKGGHIRLRSSTGEKSGTVVTIFVPLETPASSAVGHVA